MTQFPMSEQEHLQNAVRILQQRVQDPFVVQIGAMDGVSFDPIHPFIRQFGWKGLLVEPLPDVYEELRDNYKGFEGLRFENCAIASYCGTIDIYRVPRELVRSKQVPAWAAGISSVFPNRNSIGGVNLTAEQYATFKDRVARVAVPCVTLPVLLDQHRVERIDILQIDTEGSDLLVLSQMDFHRYRPSIINVEFYNLPRNEQQELFHMLLSNGYTVRTDHKDALATRLD